MASCSAWNEVADGQSGIVNRISPDPQFKILRGGEASYGTWLDMISHAKREILIEMYWFAADSVGNSFAAALAARARDGLDVCVLVDAFGSLESEALLSELERTGVSVRWYHPIRPWTPGFHSSLIGKRDHRKLIIVDSAQACVGGINITEASARWHDYSVLVNNPAAVELRRLFFDNWQNLSPRRAGSAPRINAAQRTGTAPPRASTTTFQVVADRSWVAHRALRRLYLQRIRSAKHRILIENAYFVPDAFIRNALRRAARRGVEVRILVPEVSDVPAVDLASRAGFLTLLKDGVHIHRWPNGVLHAKVAVIDEWATVGSYNLDYRSFFHNLEVNIATSDRLFVDALAADVRADIAGVPEIDLHAWRRRSAFDRVLEWIAYHFRKFL
jgi:cardiolipin synthase A/B